MPLQGGQATEQVGGPQVEKADHQGQGQQGPLPLSRHGALLGWRGSCHAGAPSTELVKGWGWGCLELAGCDPQNTPTGLWFKPHRKGQEHKCKKKKTETKKTRKQKERKATNQQEGKLFQRSLVPALQTISITMKRQNYRQTKITETTPEKETDLTSPPEKEFKIKIMNMLTEMQKKMQEQWDEMQRKMQEQWDEMQRKMQEQWDEVRKEITDVRKEITEVKQSLEGFISRMDKMQEAIEGIEAREQERIEADIERDKRISRNETTLREICDQYKRKNIRIIGIPEEEERGKGIESVFEEIIAENVPKLWKEIRHSGH